MNLLDKEKQLQKASSYSIEGALQYVLFECTPPIADYGFAVKLLKAYVTIYLDDPRPFILGAYLSSTWLASENNDFLKELIGKVYHYDDRTKAIIYYLYAYNTYLLGESIDECRAMLQESISLFGFVNNYLLLARIADRKEARKLITMAKGKVRKVWEEEEIMALPDEFFWDYENYINEHILGIDISRVAYELQFNF